MLARLSLRARLLIGLLALATVALVVADFATYRELRSFLLGRTDTSLASAQGAIEHAGLTQGTLSTLVAVIPGYSVEVRSVSGEELVPLHQYDAVHDDAPPRMPEHVSLVPGTPTDHRGPPEGDAAPHQLLTVPSEDGGTHYRVRVFKEMFPGGQEYVFLLAASLHPVESTIHRLLMVELLTTLVALAAMGALGLYVIRLGLRPLDEIEETAAAIGAGDLSRRVERADPGTEVGRLGIALNAMLGQIETAFKAREASESRLRRFVADASHELRTPLSAVRAYAELFTRGAASRPDDLERTMAGISRESERMSVLVEDLLLLARLDEGRPLEHEPVQLDEVVGEAVETARTVDPERPIEVELEPARVLGDRDRLRQVVDNLLANVRAHTPAGSPARVAVRRVDGTAELEVDDSGPGMDADEVEHVFERFFRADPSRARASGGVGLGLAIVAAVAEAHGGSVGAASAPGKGATFRVSVPLASDS
jgi:two-component system OmpR family sensor kinase